MNTVIGAVRVTALPAPNPEQTRHVMSKATNTLTYDQTVRHYLNLSHTAAMQEIVAMGLKIIATAVASMDGPELTKMQWLKLSRLGENVEDLIGTRDFEH
jgi:hypothetical protein